MAKKRISNAYTSDMFPTPQRPDTRAVYNSGMVPDSGKEFRWAPTQQSLSRFPHQRYGVAGLGAQLEDGTSGMDRHVQYIVPTGSNNLFED